MVPNKSIGGKSYGKTNKNIGLNKSIGRKCFGFCIPDHETPQPVLQTDTVF